MENIVKKILINKEQISSRVKELGEIITKDYQTKDILVVGILKGAVIFMSELIQQINKNVEIDFMAVSSYGKSSVSTGEVRIIKDLEQSVIGKNILIVEDIIDTGYTLNYLMDNLKKRGAASVKLCAFLDKTERRKVEVSVDYVGFEIPDEFIVGYGLDYAEMGRNLPFIASLKEEIYKK